MSTGERGASLLEAVISLALISGVVAAAGPLIVQSARLFVVTGRTLTDPSAAAVSGWLRRDVHQATAVEAWTGEWSPSLLALRQADGEVVTWEALEGALVRRRIAVDGHLLDRRVLLRRVKNWRWRSFRGLVEVEFELPTHLDPVAAVGRNEVSDLSTVRDERHRFTFTVRAAGGTVW